MKPAVALFVMPQEGHFNRMIALISGLAAAGADPHVFTHVGFRADVERAGGRFADLFSDRPIDEADSTSAPYPCRFVSFAGRYAEEVAEAVRGVGAGVVAYDTFAYIGPVVAQILGLPHVNVCAGHNRHPARVDAVLESLPHVEVSPECERWVEVLRGRHGLQDASPWSWLSTVSEHLNVYCEPPQYLGDAQRRALAPLVFHGSLPPPHEIEERSRCGEAPFEAPGATRVYVSFGTVVWRYLPEQALAAMRAIATALAEQEDVSAVLSVGRSAGGARIAAELGTSDVAVRDYVPQWRALADADVFITHHGLNSTHEAIWSGVPMLSVPFFGDQRELAERSQEMGIAVPLGSPVTAPIAPATVRAALARLQAERVALHGGLAAARELERQVMAGRPAVAERILSLAA